MKKFLDEFKQFISKGNVVDLAVGVIASLCGFSGANYLCRVFKKETGQSPAQWRAMAGHAAQSGLSPEESLREQELYI